MMKRPFLKWSGIKERIRVGRLNLPHPSEVPHDKRIAVLIVEILHFTATNATGRSMMP